jgi:ABC-type multidrug transport system permease subunit
LLRGKKPGLTPWQILIACALPAFVYFYLPFDWSQLAAGLSATTLFLLILLVVSGVLRLARGSDDESWTVLTIFSGTFVYPLMVLAGAVFTYRLMFPGVPDRIQFGGPASAYMWPLVAMALARAASGILFGFWLGFLDGTGETRRPDPPAVEA